MQADRPTYIRTLVFHPERALAERIAEAVRSLAVETTIAADSYDCLRFLQQHEYAVAVIDLTHTLVGTGGEGRRSRAVAGSARCVGRAGRPGGGDEPACGGDLELVRAIRRVSPLCRIVLLIDARAELELCCRAVTLGVCGFVEWGEGECSAALRERVSQAIDRYRKLLDERRELHEGQIFDQTGLAGQSRLMADLLLQARRAAMISDAPVLIHGESGTGKQLIAEAIHRLDPKRKDQPFLSVNCAAIHGTLAESALFGHVKGAFTGATEARLGYFRAAGAGTILLDEISELDRVLQPKLLRVLQVGKVLPVGADAEVDVAARIIAASNRPLPALVEKGEFRLDLYQRLNVISLNVPPLRERPEDVPLLVQFFIRKYAAYYGPGIDDVDPRVYEVLAQSIGSGNVRELENTVRQILAFKTAGHRIELSDLPMELLERRPCLRAQSDEVSSALVSAVCAMIRSGRWTLQQMLDEFERLAIREALEHSKGTHADLAGRLGITRRTLYNKLRKHDLRGLRPPE